MCMQQSAKHHSFAQCIINSMCFLNQNVLKQVNLTWLPTSKKTHWRSLMPFSKNNFLTKLNIPKWLVKTSTIHKARVNMVIVDSQFWQCQYTIVMEPDFVRWNRNRIQFLIQIQKTLWKLYTVYAYFFHSKKF